MTSTPSTTGTTGTTSTQTSVSTAVEVNASIERAFHVFTAEIGTWWDGDLSHRVCFSWDIDTEWELETDPTKASEVEITFTAIGPELGSGWSLVRFAEVAAAA